MLVLSAAVLVIVLEKGNAGLSKIRACGNGSFARVLGHFRQFKVPLAAEPDRQNSFALSGLMTQ